MPRSYSKVEKLSAIIFERKAAGKTNRQIGESYGLTKKQIKQLVTCQNRKREKLAAGDIIRPKGRPRKVPQTPKAVQEQEIRQLRMTIELLQNFLSEAGRR